MARRARFPACTLLLGVILAVACRSGSKDTASVTRTDSAGVAIVINHDSDHPLHWSFTPVLSLGGKDAGPEAFFHVNARALAVDSAGNIYLVDFDNHRLVAFDSEGHALWSVGHEGHGPGEFTYPFQLALDGASGELVVVDGGNAVIDRFDLHGKFLGADPVTPDAVTARTRFFSGGMVIERISGFTRGASSRRTDLLVIQGSDTTAIRTLPSETSKRVQVPNCPISFMQRPIFTPRIVWAGRGNRTVVTSTAEYATWLYRGNAVTESVRRDLQPVTATPELAASQFPNGEFRIQAGDLKCRASGADMAKLIGFAPVVPAVGDLALGPDGSVWVHREITADRTEPIDVFDSTGAYLGSLPDSTPWPYAFMPNGDVVSAKSDTTTGVTKLVVYRIER